MMIDILLTAYDTSFSPEQLQSLRKQPYGDRQLWVRDDGSTDDTPQAVREAAAPDGRIRLLESGETRIGALAGFAWLAGAGDGRAQYTMCCGADDALSAPARPRSEAGAAPQGARLRGGPGVRTVAALETREAGHPHPLRVGQEHRLRAARMSGRAPRTGLTASGSR